MSTTAPFPPTGWPTTPPRPDEQASLRSQAAVYVVCAAAIGIVTAAAAAIEWGAAAAVALAAGVAIGLAFDLERAFRSIPGAAAAVLAMVAMGVAIAFVGSVGVVGLALVPLTGALVLGLDWRLVRRLRPLPFGFGFLVVIGVSDGDPWTYPAGLAWLALALGALASLESDRRAAQPQVVAVAAGSQAARVRPSDLATTIVIALAVAVLAALVLTTPSCQRNPTGGSTGSGGSGLGSGLGTGSGGGSGAADPSLDAVPSPELLPGPGEAPRRTTLDDGTTVTYERGSDGIGRATVDQPDGTTRTYTYRDGSDGLIEIRELDDDGNTVRTLYYDPQGKVTTEGGAAIDGRSNDPGSTSSGSGSSGSADGSAPSDDDRSKAEVDGRLLALLLAVLVAVGALVWWVTRRRPKAPPPDAPPWAMRLAHEIEQEGRRRGAPRARSQSLDRYGAELRRGVVPDERLSVVTDLVSAALFARSEPGPDARQRAERTWEEILADTR